MCVPERFVPDSLFPGAWCLHDIESAGMRVIDPSQPLPVYAQLKTLLTEDIIRGRYAPGERLPTEHELCATYGISRTPVHRALAELAEEGAILRHRRRGTFVNPHWLTQNGRADELRVVVPEGHWRSSCRTRARPASR